MLDRVRGRARGWVRILGGEWGNVFTCRPEVIGDAV